MAKDLIRYDLMVQEALRGVVRRVLTDAARNGMPGDHHFYVTFRTQAPGVRLSDRMREKYPDEMNIILQHQFWDLTVNENAFEVGLSFGGAPERLLVPFAAVCAFYDPSVEFALKFETQGEVPAAAEVPAPMPPALASVKSAPARVAALKEAGKPETAKPRSALARVERAPEKDKGAGASGNGHPSGNGNDAKADTKVISIDSFRKKP